MVTEGNPALNRLSAAWGVLGIMALLVFAIVRLSVIAAEAIAAGLTALQWSMLVSNVIFMAWSEGFKGFQQRFSPRVAARALYLYRHDVPIGTRLLAPLFCCGYFGAGRRTQMRLWIGTVAIVTLVVLVHRLDQPWRGIVDAGVVVGLTWGMASFIASVARAFATGDYEHSPEVT